MATLEISYCMELIDEIARKLGGDKEAVKDFIKDFSKFSETILEDSDEDYVEVEDTASSSDSDSDIPTIDVDEEYTTEVDKEGFHSLKECLPKDK